MSPTLTSPVRPARRGAVAVAGLASFALAACGAEQTSAPAASSAPPAASTSAPAPSASASASASSAPSASPGVEDNAKALVAAGKTAVKAVSGGTLVSIETETNAGTPVWEVKIVTRDGDEQELDVSADGSDVVRKPGLERQDAEDRRENLALVKGSKLDYADAVEALPTTVAGGAISELALDEEGSQAVWEAEVRDTANVRHEIQVDASSGDVLTDRT